jgi:hypothetical protein
MKKIDFFSTKNALKMDNGQFICGTPDEKRPEVIEFKRREEARISKTGMHVFILPRSDELDAVQFAHPSMPEDLTVLWVWATGARLEIYNDGALVCTRHTAPADAKLRPAPTSEQLIAYAGAEAKQLWDAGLIKDIRGSIYEPTFYRATGVINLTILTVDGIIVHPIWSRKQQRNTHGKTFTQLYAFKSTVIALTTDNTAVLLGKHAWCENARHWLQNVHAVHTNRTNAIIVHNCGGTLNALLLPSHSIANVTKITVFDERMFVETTTSLWVITGKKIQIKTEKKFVLYTETLVVVCYHGNYYGDQVEAYDTYLVKKPYAGIVHYYSR